MLWTAVGAVGGVAGAFMGVFALVQTNKTNDIAKDANDKADEANQIAEKALRHDIEDSHVDWEADWNEETQSLIVTNTGKDIAHDVAVVVNAMLPGSGERFHRAETSAGNIPDGKSVTVHLPEAVEDRKKLNHMLENDLMGRYLIVTKGVHWKCKLGIDVTWKTDGGFPKIKHLDHVIS